MISPPALQFKQSTLIFKFFYQKLFILKTSLPRIKESLPFIFSIALLPVSSCPRRNYLEVRSCKSILQTFLLHRNPNRPLIVPPKCFNKMINFPIKYPNSSQHLLPQTRKIVATPLLIMLAPCIAVSHTIITHMQNSVYHCQNSLLRILVTV